MLIRILAFCLKFKQKKKKSKSKKQKPEHDDNNDNNNNEHIPGPSHSMACTKLTSQKCHKINHPNSPFKIHSCKHHDQSLSLALSFNSDNNNDNMDRMSSSSHSKTHTRPTSRKHHKVDRYNPSSKSCSCKHYKLSLSPSNSDNKLTSSKGIQEIAKSLKKVAQCYNAHASPSNLHSYQANKQYSKRVEMHCWLKQMKRRMQLSPPVSE